MQILEQIYIEGYLALQALSEILISMFVKMAQAINFIFLPTTLQEILEVVG
jgi:hypothetical protein